MKTTTSVAIIAFAAITFTLAAPTVDSDMYDSAERDSDNASGVEIRAPHKDEMTITGGQVTVGKGDKISKRSPKGGKGKKKKAKKRDLDEVDALEARQPAPVLINPRIGVPSSKQKDGDVINRLINKRSRKGGKGKKRKAKKAKKRDLGEVDALEARQPVPVLMINKRSPPGAKGRKPKDKKKHRHNPQPEDFEPRAFSEYELEEVD